MKRRPFLQSIATLGASTMLPSVALSKDLPKGTQETMPLSWKEELFENKILKKLENEYLTFTWMTDASAEILVKKTGITWRMGSVAIQEEEEIDHSHVWVRQERSICEEYPARFRGELIGEEIRFYVLDLQGKTVGTFLCKPILEKEWLTFDIYQIDEALPNLMFPTPIENDMLLLPMGVGRLIRKPLSSRFYHTWYAHLNMRFCSGINNDNNGYISVFDKGFEDAGIFAMNMSVTPVWQKSLGKWRGKKSVKYSFVDNGYVGVAKKYREWANDNGLLKKLDSKIKETPLLGNMLGGRQVSIFQAIPNPNPKSHENQLRTAAQIAETKKIRASQPTRTRFTHKEVAEIFNEVKKNWGMKSGMFNLRGWIRGGYDYSHPDVWPPEPSLGTIDDFKKICKSEGKYFTVLHDNYMDMYEHNPSFPKGICITKQGRLMRGGNWPGGQAYILNYKAGLGYAQRNWKEIKTLKTGGYFVDTTTAVQLYESYEPGNNLSKSDDLKYKIDLIKFYKSENQIFGSEESADFGVPYVDFYENRHKRTAGESVPLWPLVFHDCVMNGRYVDPSNVAPGEKSWLEDMLWGYFILFRLGGWNSTEWRNQKESFQESLPVDEWFAKIGTAEMTNHEYLSTDFELEKTTFSNGKSIVVNFSKEIKTLNGISYNPLSFTIS